jgi:hypothetical protein
MSPADATNAGLLVNHSFHHSFHARASLTTGGVGWVGPSHRTATFVGISLKDIKVDGEIPGQNFSPFLMVMERDFRGRVAYYAQLSDEVASLSSI